MRFIGFRRAAAAFAAASAISGAAGATSFQTVYTFADGVDGSGPSSRMSLDKSGVLYGTTTRAIESLSRGTIFKFDPVTRVLTTLYTFSGNADGGNPSAGLTLDKSGMIYGVTGYDLGAAPYGTIFKLDPTTQVLTTLYTFTNGADEGYPSGDMVFDKNGDLYGVTSGPYRFTGTIFKFNITTRTLTTLHSFTAPDGSVPQGGVVFNKAGLLYGTTSYGGVANYGTIYQFDPTSSLLTTLHSFTDVEGSSPLGSLILDKRGVVYGTTWTHAVNYSGTLFRFDPVSQVFTTLHNFTGPDGANPSGGVTMRAGALYGATEDGGSGGVETGTVFKYDTKKNTLTTLYNFLNGADGADIYAELTLDKKGAIYGAAFDGGSFVKCYYGCGTLFKIVP